MNHTRPDWDDYFLELAAVVAKRSTCLRKQVGCIVTLDNRILTTGYGGSIRGQPHCTDVGCDIDPATGGCVRTVHAEMNAIAQAAANGVSTRGATAYTTLSPCYWCFKTMVNAGVVRFVYTEQYRIAIDHELARACGVELVHQYGGAAIGFANMADVTKMGLSTEDTAGEFCDIDGCETDRMPGSVWCQYHDRLLRKAT